MQILKSNVLTKLLMPHESVNYTSYPSTAKSSKKWLNNFLQWKCECS